MDRSSAGCVLPCRYVDHVNGPRPAVLQVAMRVSRSTEKVGRCSITQFSLSLVTAEHSAKRSITRVNRSQLNPTRLTRCRTHQNSPPCVSFFDPIQPTPTQPTVVGHRSISGITLSFLYHVFVISVIKPLGRSDMIRLVKNCTALLMLLSYFMTYFYASISTVVSAWSVITAHNLTPAKRDNNYSPHSPTCLLYTSPSPRDRQKSRMPSSA